MTIMKIQAEFVKNMSFRVNFNGNYDPECKRVKGKYLLLEEQILSIKS